MKKLVVLVSFLFATLVSVAQSTTPRFGTSANADNTFRTLTLGLTPVSDTAGATPDTLLITPGVGNRGGVYLNHYEVTLTDSAVLAIRSVGSCFKGDRMTVAIYNTAGSNHWLKFLGYSALATKWNTQTSGTSKLSLLTGATTILEFYFTGTKWSEVSRSVND